MTIKYQEKSFLSFQEYIDHAARNGVDGLASTPLYAHPVDGWIIKSLNSTPVKSAMNKALDAIVSFNFGGNLVRGIVIEQNSFPELFAVLSHCSKTLCIPIPHSVTEHREDALLNAFTAGTDEYSFIVISSALYDVMTKEEVCFVIGHECGHIAAGHAANTTLVNLLLGALKVNPLIGSILKSTAGLPLTAWSRRSEITADRAGLLCCGDVRIAQKALLRLVIGLANIENVDIDNYLRRARETKKFHKIPYLFNQLFATHPDIPKRIEALELFADSEIYYHLSGKSKPAGKTLLTQEELDKQVRQLIKP